MMSMTEILKKERRCYERFGERHDIEFSSNGKTYRGISSNFSLSGLFVKTPNPLEPETIVAIILHLPDGSTTRITGRVTRVVKAPPGNTCKTSSPYREQGGMAIEIIEKDPLYLKFVASFRTRVIDD